MNAERPARYVLTSEDGRFVTNDTRFGVSFTRSAALAYVWPTPGDAERQREAYEATLGAALTVRLLA